MTGLSAFTAKFSKGSAASILPVPVLQLTKNWRAVMTAIDERIAREQEAVTALAAEHKTLALQFESGEAKQSDLDKVHAKLEKQRRRVADLQAARDQAKANLQDENRTKLEKAEIERRTKVEAATARLAKAAEEVDKAVSVVGKQRTIMLNATAELNQLGVGDAVMMHRPLETLPLALGHATAGQVGRVPIRFSEEPPKLAEQVPGVDYLTQHLRPLRLPLE